jgi:transposase
LGTAEAIINRRTILPYFLPFHSLRIALLAFEAMRSGPIAGLKYQLGLITSHFRANFPLKSCPDCLLQDRSEFGTAYWHRSHQLPGTWVCLKHDQILLESNLKSTSAQRFNWILPDESHIRSMVTHSPSLNIDRLRGLASNNTQLLELPTSWHFDLSLVAQSLQKRLSSLGLASPSGRIKTNEIGPAFFAFAEPLRQTEEFQLIASTVDVATTQSRGYFHKIQAITHPLRHILMFTWLFGDWKNFISAYQREANELADESNFSLARIENLNADKGELRLTLRDECTRLSTIDKLSATAISLKLGVSITTVINRLAEAGISTPKRPKLLKEPQTIALRQSLLNGDSKQAAAEISGVSLQSVTRFLFSEVGLYSTWCDLRQALALDGCRARWEDILSNNRTASIKLLRSIEPKTYAWLYRNDKQWLTDKNKARIASPFAQGRAVDWARRDQELFSQLTNAIEESLNGTSSTKRIPITELIRRVPTLKPYVNKLDLLPRTRQLLDQHIVRGHKANRELFSDFDLPA